MKHMYSGVERRKIAAEMRLLKQGVAPERFLRHFRVLVVICVASSILSTGVLLLTLQYQQRLARMQMIALLAMSTGIAIGSLVSLCILLYARWMPRAWYETQHAMLRTVALQKRMHRAVFRSGRYGDQRPKAERTGYFMRLGVSASLFVWIYLLFTVAHVMLLLLCLAALGRSSCVWIVGIASATGAAGVFSAARLAGLAALFLLVHHGLWRPRQAAHAPGASTTS